MADPDLEVILRQWGTTTSSLDEKSRLALTALYRHERIEANRLKLPWARGKPAEIILTDLTGQTTEMLGEPTDIIISNLVQQGYVQVHERGCLMRCKGYEVLESLNFTYSKLILSMHYLHKARQQTRVSTTLLANLAGINRNATGHFTRFLEKQGLVRRDIREEQHQTHRTYVELTERGHSFAEYLDSDRSSPYKSRLLSAWSRGTKRLLACS